MISIVIPVYNSEKYIARCIESILKQTFKEYELIIVNDGSTDNSLGIIEAICKDYKNITIVNKKNGGVSKARNAGIEKAKGEYICFIDSDDYIDENFLQNLVQTNNCDWVLSGIYDVNRNEIQHKILLKDKIWDMELPCDCKEFYKTPLLTAPFPKLYKLDIINNNNIRYNSEISLAEDREFNYTYSLYIKNIKTISYIGYYYNTENQSSLSKKPQPYKLKYDCLHWALLKKAFYIRNIQDNDTEVINLLVNELFYSIYDDLILLVKHYSIKDALHYSKINLEYVNYKYLKTHKNLIKASKWQTKLILHVPYKITIYILHLLLKWKNRKE